MVVLGTIKAWSWAPSEGEPAGETLTRLEVTAETVAASLQWATVTISKAERGESWADAPVVADGEQEVSFSPSTWPARLPAGSSAGVAKGEDLPEIEALLGVSRLVEAALQQRASVRSFRPLKRRAIASQVAT